MTAAAAGHPYLFPRIGQPLQSTLSVGLGPSPLPARTAARLDDGGGGDAAHDTTAMLPPHSSHHHLRSNFRSTLITHKWLDRDPQGQKKSCSQRTTSTTDLHHAPGARAPLTIFPDPLTPSSSSVRQSPWLVLGWRLCAVCSLLWLSRLQAGSKRTAQV